MFVYIKDGWRRRNGAQRFKDLSKHLDFSKLCCYDKELCWIRLNSLRNREELKRKRGDLEGESRRKGKEVDRFELVSEDWLGVKVRID